MRAIFGTDALVRIKKPDHIVVGLFLKRLNIIEACIV